MSCSPNLLSSPPSHEPVDDEIHYSRIHSFYDHCLLTMIALKIRVLESMSQLERSHDPGQTKRMRPHLWAKVWDWIWAKVGAEKEAQEGSALIAAIRLSPTQCWDAGSVVKISQCWDAEILTQPPVVKISQSWPSLLLSVFLTRLILPVAFWMRMMNWLHRMDDVWMKPLFV